MNNQELTNVIILKSLEKLKQSFIDLNASAVVEGLRPQADMYHGAVHGVTKAIEAVSLAIHKGEKHA